MIMFYFGVVRVAAAANCQVYHSQMSVSVVDPGRRVKLKEEAKTRCLVPYR